MRGRCCYASAARSTRRVPLVRPIEGDFPGLYRVLAKHVLVILGPSVEKRFWRFGSGPPRDAHPHAQAVCAFCLEAKANWVFESCGHKCICGECRGKMIAFKVGHSVQKNKRKIILACPLCRAEGRFVSE